MWKNNRTFSEIDTIFIEKKAKIEASKSKWFPLQEEKCGIVLSNFHLNLSKK